MRAALDFIKNAPRLISAGAFFISALSVAAGCGPGEEAPDTPSARGERIYKANCIACHNPNPAFDGAVGPALKGSSRELVEARVLGSEYPPGYTPKRTTKIMPAQPHLAPHIDDLTAFLNE